MKYVMYLLFGAIMFISGNAISQNDYRTHVVQENESIWKIAEKYGLTKADIVKLNPNVADRPLVNSVLVLPKSAKGVTTAADPIKFKKHKVRRKETLFSISTKYKVTVEELKRYNKELYARPLKKGERIRIPVYAKSKEEREAPVVVIAPVVPPTTGTTRPVSSDLGKITGHTVQAKETRYGIARMYGITLADLESINPHIGAILSIGQIINVPAETVMDTAVPEEGFMFYEVLPKEGFFRLKVKTGLTEEEIVGLNPYAKDGLKEGMILKIPKSASAVVEGNASEVDLEDNIVNNATKRVAVLLPFRLNKAVVDSVNSASDVIKNDKLMALSLDFYSGVLMATEFAKDKGISTILDVHDTEYSSAKVERVLRENNFENFDAVIGPLGQKQVEKAASLLNNGNVPVFSPLSNKAVKSSKNLFQTLPDDAMLEDAMIDFLKEESTGKNLIVISDGKRAAQKGKLMAAFPAAKTAKPREEGFLYVQDIVDQIDVNKENWVILESNDPVLVSNVVGVLNGLPAAHKLRLFSLDKNEAYDYHDVSNMHLAKLNFTFPSVNKNYNYKDREPFLISYKNKYGVLPNKYAVRGFDITYDVLLRLASNNDIYEASEADYTTEYIENKFRYSKKFMSGYVNNAFYIIKYKDDLQFEVIR